MNKSNFIPSWSEKHRTKEAMEKDLDIVFCGDGWYTKGSDCALVFEEDGWYYVAMYLHGNAANCLFQEIGNLPVRA